MSEERARAALEASGLDFTITRHGPVSSLEEAAAARGIEPANIVKTLVVRRGDDDYLFVLVPGDRTISWPKLRALLGVSRLSMPDKEVAREVTGYERGTITPFGSTTAWPVVADSRVVRREATDVPGSGDVVGQDEAGEDPLGGPDGVSPLVSIGAGAFGVAASVDGAGLARVLGAQVADVTEPV